MSIPQWFATETKIWSHDPHSASIKIVCRKKEDVPASLRMIIASGKMLETLETIKRRMYEPRQLMLEEVEAMIDEAIFKARGVRP